MKRNRLAASAGLLVLVGCARGPNITTDALPLTRVVVYRNGVGYFERAGEVEASEVRFKMRQRMVGDFLATLAIVERGGSSVRAASFPLALDEPEEVPEPGPEGILKPWPQPPREQEDPGEKMREVVLSLDGQRHALSIGYVAETPVWRPSYRLVVTDGGEADLQAWGIVQNLSGEDWTQVRLALVAGAPLAFQSTLGDPVVPPRPIVTDSGEVIESVPTGVTSLEQTEGDVEYYGQEEEDADKEEAPAEEVVTTSEKADGYAAGPPGRGGMARMRKSKPMSRSAAPPPPPRAAPPEPEPLAGMAAEALSRPRRLSALAAVKVSTGTTRYEIPNPVTVPDDSATMVLLVSKAVQGGAVFLYAPDPGVGESTMHPFRVARFENQTQGLLERGPIAVYEAGSFLGQGMLESLPVGAKATVPFALERSLAVSVKHDVKQRGARLHKIEAGEIWIERDQVFQTTYAIKNGSKELARMLVKHPRNPETRLHHPPEGTEDNPAQGHALVPLEVKAGGRSELLVDERRGFPQQTGWLSTLADEAVRAYLRDPRANTAAAQELSAAWKLREVWKKAADEQSALETEENQLAKDARETRLSLKAIEKNNQATDLRVRLTARLGEISRRMEVVTKRLVEVRLAISEQEVRFREAIRRLHIVAPPQPAA